MKRILLLICILALSLGLFAADVIIGTGNISQRFPLGNWFGYERSAALYTAAEIGLQNGSAQTINISELLWDIGRSTNYAVPTKIYLKTTGASTLSAVTWATMISGASLRYDQTQSSLSAGAWNPLTLNANFSMGVNENLIIMVERNYGDGGSGDPEGNLGNKIKATTATGTHYVWLADDNAPTGVGQPQTSRPNLWIRYTEVSTIASFPFREGFEAGNAPWSTAVSNWTQDRGPEFVNSLWTTNNSWTDYNRGSRSGTWNACLTSAGQSYLFRPIQLTAGRTYTVEIYARQDGNNPSNAKMQVKYGSYPSVNGMIETVIPETGIIGGDYQRLYGTFTATSTGISYIGIQGWINPTPYFISLDDITINELPSPITSLPFFEGFETGNTNQSTDIKNWLQFTGPQYTGNQWTANNSETSGNRSPRTGAWNAFLKWGGESYLTRPIQLSAGKAYTVELYARQDASDPSAAKIQVKYGSSASIAGMNQTIIPQTGLSSGNYQRLYGVFSPVTSGIYYIGIQGWINGVPYCISLDDITIAELPPAPPITSFPFVDSFETGNMFQSTIIKDWAQIDGPTYSGQFWTANTVDTGHNTAPQTGNWNATLRYGGQSTLFRKVSLTAGKIYSVELYARQDGSNVNDASIQVKYGTEPTLAGMNQAIIASTGLTNGNYQRLYGTFIPSASGIYYIGIQGKINNTPWYISLDDITIDQLLPITSLPFRENFDTGNDNQSPIKDWAQITGPMYPDKEWVINYAEITYNRKPRSGTTNATLKWNGQSCMYRPIQMTGGKTYFIEFYARQDGMDPANATVQVKIGTQPTLAGMNQNIIPETGLTNGDYQRFYKAFTPTTTGIYYIGIQGWINNNPWYISLDDIIIDELAPAITSLPFFEGFETGNTHNSTVVKNWNQTFGPDYSIRNWRANSTYTDYNRAPRTGTWNTFLLYNGDTSLTRRIQLTAGKAYSFELYARQDTDNPANAKIQVLYGVDGSLIDQTIIAQTGLTNGNYQRFFGTFTASSTDTYYIAIHGWANHLVQYISLDDITIAELATPIASFPFRESFNVGNTDQSTTIKDWIQAVGPEYTARNWTANSSLTNYNRTPRTILWNATLQYGGQSTLIRPIELIAGKTYYMRLYARQDGSIAANATIKVNYGTEGSLAGMTQNIIPETGLTNGDYQDLYGTFSPASSGIYYIGIQGWIHNTQWYISLDDIIIDELPLPITSFPFVESFEVGNTDQSSAIKNWMQATGPQYVSKYWTANSSGTVHNRTPRTGNFNASLAWEGESCLIRPMELAADTEYFIELYVRQNSNVPGDATIQVKYGSHGSIGGMTETIVAQTGLVYGDYQRFYGTFTPATTGTYYIGIQGWLNYEPYYISLDDITIGIVMPEPIALPFTEGWDSEGFAANHWTKEGDNWWVDAEIGSPEPSVNFYYHPREFNYEIALNSHEFDATGMDQVQFSFDLCLSNDDASVENGMTWMIWDGDNWTWLGEYSSLDGELDWTTYTYNISQYASNRIFKIRFVASGVDSYAINNWYLDNITLSEGTAGSLGSVTDLVISQVGSNIILNWSPVDGATWYHVEKSPNPAGPFVSVGWTEGDMIPVAMTGLPGNKYFFRVMAGTGVRSAGEISISTPAISSPAPIRTPKLEIAPKLKRK
ncbi:MAG: hypothetical protein PHG34_06775 [Candidatus Cloacimonetes bacterium]|nr:hypothetical protein [Candidatus Cloacimonadota bacterium]